MSSKTISFTELLADAPKNWGRWGEDDEVGALNFLTADEVLRGVAHVKSGKVFTLQRLIGDPKGEPVWPGRKPATITMITDEATWNEPGALQLPGGFRYCDDRIETSLQGSTQYDALGHAWYDGQLWNGYDARSTIGGLAKASVEPIAQRGIVGRGVLLDMARFRGREYLEKGDTFNHEDLEACAEAQGHTIEPRDILLIRTNFLHLFFENPDTFFEGLVEPGLTYSPELVRWFYERKIPNLVTDTIANETTVEPNTGVQTPLHCALMRNLGVTFTEICDLEALADDCATDGRYTFLYAAGPLKVHRATGSPVNPLAIK